MHIRPLYAGWHAGQWRMPSFIASPCSLGRAPALPVAASHAPTGVAGVALAAALALAGCASAPSPSPTPTPAAKPVVAATLPTTLPTTAATPPQTSPDADHTAGFAQWLSSFSAQALEAGIRPATVRDVLGKALIGNKPIGVSGGLYQFGKFDVKARTQELRLTSPDKGVVRYVAGLWYGKNELARKLTRAPVTTYVTDYGATAYNTNYAVFGQGSFDLTPKTSVVAGLRYNKEDTGYTFSRYNPPPATSRVLTEYFKGDDSERKTTGKLGLEHRIDQS
eukprot:gene18902-26768_t